MAALLPGYKVETAAALEETGNANVAVATVLRLLIILMMVVIVFGVRSLAAMVLLTTPLALAGVFLTLLIFEPAFRIQCDTGNDRSGRHHHANMLILIGRINQNERDGFDRHDAVVEATA